MVFQVAARIPPAPIILVLDVNDDLGARGTYFFL
jgi:hypothetical protein